MPLLLASLKFFLIIGWLFFAPGWLILRIFFGKKYFVPFETLIFSFGISIGLLDFLMIVLGKYGLTLNAYTITYGIVAILVLLASLMFLWKRLRKNETESTGEIETDAETKKPEYFSFTPLQTECPVASRECELLTGFTRKQSWL